MLLAVNSRIGALKENTKRWVAKFVEFVRYWKNEFIEYSITTRKNGYNIMFFKDGECSSGLDFPGLASDALPVRVQDVPGPGSQ
jgi:hypothetical protein